ncbi:MAG TPA: DUF1565 domain-containing protein, partial [Nitrospirae bacterium]|nr:DUF1565 domain-containing protein [Nitrospirota bacterium]
MKFPQYIGLLALCLLIASCSSGSSSVSDSSDEGWTEVSVTIGERSGGSAAQGPELFPASIETFRFTVTGPDMSPMKEIVDVQGQDTITVVFVVPNGPDRCFRIDALDGDGRLLYSGVTCADIQGPTSVTVYMRTQCDIYVDINTGDDDINDGSIAMPLETITRAIEEAGIREIDNAVICVAAGTYYGSGGYAYAPPPSAPELAV